jgi:hypothetical protein
LFRPYFSMLTMMAIFGAAAGRSLPRAAQASAGRPRRTVGDALKVPEVQRDRPRFQEDAVAKRLVGLNERL